MLIRMIVFFKIIFLSSKKIKIIEYNKGVNKLILSNWNEMRELLFEFLISLIKLKPATKRKKFINNISTNIKVGFFFLSNKVIKIIAAKIISLGKINGKFESILFGNITIDWRYEIKLVNKGRVSS